jgi:DNA polymerase phi
MASKRRRDIATADTQLIEIYEDLANENEEIRLKAAHTLLSKFSHPASTSPGIIKTIVQRLFRGLCSSRKAARLGFSIALTEYLAQIFQYPTEETGLTQQNILDILDKQTVTDGSTSGQVCICRNKESTSC